MSLRDKITNIFFKPEESEEQKIDSDKSISPKARWTDIFYTDADEEPKPQKGFFDFLFEDSSEDKTTVSSSDDNNVLDNIESKISLRESELITLASFFKSVDARKYQDSGSEYQAYLSLVDQLKKLKGLLVLTTDDSINTMNKYQLETSFKKFEADYAANIGAIQSLCYLNELATLNSSLKELFSSHFTAQVEHKIDQSDKYLSLIRKKSSMFAQKYSTRISKEIIEADYRLTILQLMSQIKASNEPYKNPFANFPEAKKKVFATYLSEDIRNTNAKYNEIANNKRQYIKYGNIGHDQFDSLDASATIISEEINQYSIDDFLLNELLENGNGYNTLLRFLKFKLQLNSIDSKTNIVEQKSLDSDYRATTGKRRPVYPTSSRKTPQSGRSYPDFEDDL